MIKKIILIACLVLLPVGVKFIGAAMNSVNYQIWADTFSQGGGDDLTSVNYQLGETLGETSIGVVSSTAYSIKAGFREINYFLSREVLTLSIDSNELKLGKLKTDVTGTASHQLTVDTNSYHGLSVTFGGNTLTCEKCLGANKTVLAIGTSADTSKRGTSQFGFNVLYITSTAATPRASAVAPYDGVGQYAFSAGDEIISSSRSINQTVFNVNYIANIKGTEATGVYTTTITYTATANF